MANNAALAAQIQRLNSTFETIAACRQRPPAVDAKGRKRPPRLTRPEIADLSAVLAEHALAHPELALGVARDAAALVPNDHRGFDFHVYGSCALFRLERNADAYLNWHRAAIASPPPSPSEHTDKKIVHAASAAPPTVAAVETAAPPTVAAVETAAPPTVAAVETAAPPTVAAVETAAPPTVAADADGAATELELRPRTRRQPRAAFKVDASPTAAPSSNATDSEDFKRPNEMTLRERVRPTRRPRGDDKKNTTDIAPTTTVAKGCDSQNLALIRTNMNYALQKMVPPAVQSTDLLTLEQIYKVHHVDHFSSYSIVRPWHAFNPSIVPSPHDPQHEFTVVLRTAAYSMTPQHKYTYPPGHSGILTKNMLVTIPVGFKGTDAGKSTLIRAPVPPHPNPAIAGEEDMRIVEGSAKPDDTMLVTFTSLEQTPRPMPQVCIATLDLKKARLTNPVRLFGIDAADRAQKNWQCFMYEGVPHAVYAQQPITVVRIDRETGECKIVSIDACPVINSWRGSSPLIRLPEKLRLLLPDIDRRHRDGDLWFASLLHVSNFPRYHHLFEILRLRPSPWSSFRPFSMQLMYLAPSFVFKTHDVEFSCGFAFTPDASEIVLPFAQRDEFCHLARISSDSWCSKFVAVPSPDEFQLA
jgi:hypothetical protein